MSGQFLAGGLLFGLLHGLRLVPSLLVAGSLLGPGLPGPSLLGLGLLLGSALSWVGAADLPNLHALAALSLPNMLGQAALELGFGALLGLLMLAPLLAFRMAGGMSDLALLGHGHGPAGDGPLARCSGLLSLALFAALGGLRLMADVFVSSFVRYPVGTLVGQLRGDPLLVVRLFGDAFLWALLLAAPLLLCAFFVSLVLSIGARLMSGFEGVVAEAVPLRVLAVLAMALLSLAAAAPVMRDRTELALAAVRSILLP